jgi:hypothetical protein
MYIFGIPFLLMLGFSLVTGRAYLRGWVHRSEAPFRYWTAVIVCALMASVLFSLGPVR